MVGLLYCVPSSEDEISQWLDGTPQQQNAIRRRSIGLPSDSSDDEFEKEMMSELDNTMTKNFPLSQQALKSKKQQGMISYYNPGVVTNRGKCSDKSCLQWHFSCYHALREKGLPTRIVCKEYIIYYSKSVYSTIDKPHSKC